jgi:hypothetical protein
MEKSKKQCQFRLTPKSVHFNNNNKKYNTTSVKEVNKTFTKYIFKLSKVKNNS